MVKSFICMSGKRLAGLTTVKEIGTFLKNGGPPSVVGSVVGGYRNILACSASSLSAAHQNIGTALSLKSKAGMSCQLTTGRKPGGSQYC
jgi:hypothetical protein